MRAKLWYKGLNNQGVPMGTREAGYDVDLSVLHDDEEEE